MCMSLFFLSVLDSPRKRIDTIDHLQSHPVLERVRLVSDTNTTVKPSV